MALKVEPVGIYPATQAANVLGLVKDIVRDYGASGSAQTTTGSIPSGTTTLTLASAEDFANGQSLVVYGAGDSISDCYPPGAPSLSQASGSTAFAASEVVYVGYTWVTPTGETGLNTSSITISAAGNQIHFTTDAAPFGASAVNVYAADTTSVLLLGTVNFSQYTDTSTGSLTSSWANASTQFGPLAPFPGATPTLQLTITVAALGTGAAPPASGTTASPTPAGSIATVGGASGNYTYYLVTLNEQGGATAASAGISTSTGPANNCSRSNYNEITLPYQMATAYAIFGGSGNPTGSRGLIGLSAGGTWRDYGQDTANGVLPNAAVALTIPALVPSGTEASAATAPSSIVPNYLKTTIVSGGGTSTLTLADAAGATVSSGAVYHNDGPALGTAFTTLFNGTGGKLMLPAGTYYVDPADLPDLAAVTNGNMNVEVQGHGYATRIIALPGASSRPIFGSTSTHSLNRVVFKDLELDGNWFAGTLTLGFSWVASECRWENVRVVRCYDGINTKGNQYATGAYMNQIVNCFLDSNAHVAIVQTNDGTISGCIGGYNGSDRPICTDGIQAGVLLADSGVMASTCHIYGDYVDWLIWGSGNRLTAINFDDDAVDHHLKFALQAGRNQITASLFGAALFAGQTAVTFGNLASDAAPNEFIGNVWDPTGISGGSRSAWTYCLDDDVTNNPGSIVRSNTFAGSFSGSLPVNLASGTVLQGNDIPQGTVQPTTSLAGTTAGSITFAMPEQGTAKKFVAVASGYENDTTTAQTITFPTPFANAPVVTTNTTGLTVTATTTTLTITAPDSTTTYSGVLVVEGI